MCMLDILCRHVNSNSNYREQCRLRQQSKTWRLMKKISHAPPFDGHREVTEASHRYDTSPTHKGSAATPRGVNGVLYALQASHFHNVTVSAHAAQQKGPGVSDFLPDLAFFFFFFFFSLMRRKSFCFGFSFSLSFTDPRGCEGPRVKLCLYRVNKAATDLKANLHCTNRTQ